MSNVFTPQVLFMIYPKMDKFGQYTSFFGESEIINRYKLTNLQNNEEATYNTSNHATISNLFRTDG